MILSNLTMRVLRLPRLIKRLIVLLVDVCICVLSVYFSFYLRIGEWVPIFTTVNWDAILVLEASILFGLPIFLVFGLYREIFRHSGWFATLSLLRAMSLYFLIFILVFTVFGIEGVPRTLGLIQPIVLLMLVGGSRALASYWFSNSYRKQLRLEAIPRVLIYGAGEAGRQLIAALSRNHDIQIMGFLDDDSRLHGSVLEGKRIYNPSRLKYVVASLDITKVLLAIPSISRFRRNQIIELIRDTKVGIQTLPSMSDLASGKISAQDLRSLDIDDLLGRELVLPDCDLLAKNSSSKVLMVTGAGGSIGSELCRQIIEQTPKTLILFDQSEYALYKIH
jgi:FlaA1/EpsC-like NDP-sugar epimerase